MPLNIVFSEAPKLVSTKTLLLKHYYRLQGYPFLSFLGLSRFFRIFPICLGMVRGFSRFVPFLFLGLLRAPTGNSPERVRDTIWTYPEKSGTPPWFGNPPGLASLKKIKIHSFIPSGAPGLHALLNYFGVNFRSDYTYTYTFNCSWNYLPAQNQYLQEKNLGELIFARRQCWPVFALARIQENLFGEVFPKYFAKFLREFISVRIHAAPVFAPARIQENTPGELFMYWFRARG